MNNQVWLVSDVDRVDFLDFVVDLDLMNVVRAIKKTTHKILFDNLFKSFTSNEDDRWGSAIAGVSSNKSSSSENNFLRIWEIFNDEFEIVTGASSRSLFEAKLCINESISAAGGSERRVWQPTRNTIQLISFLKKE